MFQEVEHVSYVDKEIEAVSRQREEDTEENAISFFSALMIPVSLPYLILTEP